MYLFSFLCMYILEPKQNRAPALLKFYQQVEISTGKLGIDYLGGSCYWRSLFSQSLCNQPTSGLPVLLQKLFLVSIFLRACWRLAAATLFLLSMLQVFIGASYTTSTIISPYTQHWIWTCRKQCCLTHSV